MADNEVNITPPGGFTAGTVAEHFEKLARRQRILDHLAESRRARASSNIDDRSAAVRARIQRRLLARRRATAATQRQEIEAGRLADAERNEAQPATDSRRAFPEAEASFYERDPSRDEQSADGATHSRIAKQDPEAPDVSPASRRIIRFPGQAAAPGTDLQGEIGRLQARAQGEKERADFVTALLESVLSSSTASLLRHQARLEAMQAQINALQGR